MAVITFARGKPKYVAFQTLFDQALETGGIAIDQNAYSSGLDRLFDVRGKKTMYAEIKNTGGANGLTYKIEKARKEYTDDGSSLIDADFDKDIKGDTPVAFGAKDINDIIDISPETTAIRLRIKRTTAGLDTTLAGFVSID